MSSPYIHFNELGDKCAHCGIQGELEIHHKDGNRKNNNLENLILFCHRCHMAEHRQNRVHGDVRLVNFVCPVTLLDQFHEAWKGSYASRTEVLRDLMRKFIEQSK